MPGYNAPLDDMRFVLREFVGLDPLRRIAAYEEVTDELVDAILDQADKFTRDLLQPLNRSGDEEGCTFANGEVTTPSGFKEAYAQYVEAGWGTLTCAPEHGGQGLPEAIGIQVQEMVCAANLSFGTYPGLTHGAYATIAAHGDARLEARYLPPLVDGRWSGTMCLTEPQCGTDLGLVRTKAVPADDGGYRITGSKIFISAGEHDLCENIVHLVLARLPDAPEGIRGLSLFVVPKFLVDDAGALGARNRVRCGALEHKMGIKASATCAIDFDDAAGHLVGAPHRGMQAMFTMMNAARLAVGIQGLGLAEAAYQGAVAYARERLQGRALKGPRYPDQPADPIIVHPDVRRMLLTMRAYTEGARALGTWVGTEIDIARAHPDPATREAAADFVQLLTPVVKAFFTDIGFEVTNLGVQVLGGHGYIREQGMEQLVRDARIAQIYEGTNGIQALDLVGRKLPAHMGRYLRQFFHPVDRFLSEHAAEPEMEEFVVPLAKAFSRLQRATARLAQEGRNDPDEAAAAATDYLRLFGLVAMGYAWARMARIALGRDDDQRAGFYAAKVRTARFFMQRLLPQSGALFSAIMAGGGAIMDFEEAVF